MNSPQHTYIIGEIGQNHNGSVDIAKLIVDLVARPVRDEASDLDLRPMDAVKLTKRDLKEELAAEQMNRPYNSPTLSDAPTASTAHFSNSQTRNTWRSTTTPRASDSISWRRSARPDVCRF